MKEKGRYMQISSSVFLLHIWKFSNLCQHNQLLKLVFSRGFFIFAEMSETLKKNRLEELLSPVKWSAWLYASTLQNFARRYFFAVNGVSIVILWERDIEMGENMWKKFKTKAQEDIAWQEIWRTSFHLFKVCCSDHWVNYFPLMYRYGINANILHLTFSPAKFWSFLIKC